MVDNFPSLILSCRQVVGHQTLTLAFAGPSPASSATSEYNEIGIVPHREV